MKRKLGWKRDAHDVRDKFYGETKGLRSLDALPKSVDMRHQFHNINDQKSLGSCVSQAATCAMEYLDKINKRKLVEYSRLFIYYNSRWDKKKDTGATIRAAFKAMAKYGSPPESIWPYKISKFAKMPSDDAYRLGADRQAMEYLRVKKDELKQVLADGFPIEFGFDVHKSFYGLGANGTMPTPNGKIDGGHAVLLVGYRGNGDYIVRNSWGKRWGHHGYFYMPESFINSDHCSDFWVVKRIEDGTPNARQEGWINRLLRFFRIR